MAAPRLPQRSARALCPPPPGPVSASLTPAASDFCDFTFPPKSGQAPRECQGSGSPRHPLSATWTEAVSRNVPPGDFQGAVAEGCSPASTLGLPPSAQPPRGSGSQGAREGQRERGAPGHPGHPPLTPRDWEAQGHMTAGVEPRMFGGYSLTGKQRWANDHALRDPQKLLRRGNKGLERGRVLPKVTQEILGRTSLRPPTPSAPALAASARSQETPSGS